MRAFLIMLSLLFISATTQFSDDCYCGHCVNVCRCGNNNDGAECIQCCSNRGGANKGERDTAGAGSILNSFIDSVFWRKEKPNVEETYDNRLRPTEERLKQIEIERQWKLMEAEQERLRLDKEKREKQERERREQQRIEAERKKKQKAEEERKKEEKRIEAEEKKRLKQKAEEKEAPLKKAEEKKLSDYILVKKEAHFEEKTDEVNMDTIGKIAGGIVESIACYATGGALAPSLIKQVKNMVMTLNWSNAEEKQHKSEHFFAKGSYLYLGMDRVVKEKKNWLFSVSKVISADVKFLYIEPRNNKNIGKLVKELKDKEAEDALSYIQSKKGWNHKEEL